MSGVSLATVSAVTPDEFRRDDDGCIRGRVAHRVLDQDPYDLSKEGLVGPRAGLMLPCGVVQIDEGRGTTVDAHACDSEPWA